MAGDSGMAGKVALLLWAQTLSLAGAQTTQLLVDPPWTPPVLWDRVTLICQGSGTSGDTTWYKDGQLWLQHAAVHFPVNESGTYSCHQPDTGRSPSVRVINDWLVLQVPARPLLEGDTVTLRCRVRENKPVTSLSFHREEEELTRSVTGTELSLSPLQLNHSGNYSCKGVVSFGTVRVIFDSNLVTVTVHVPVANATITPGPPALQVHTGDPVTLRCSVQVGSAPVTFTWLCDGREVAQGPVVELGDIDVGHSGTYQCVATNQLNSVVSPELALEVTPQGHWGTAVAVNVGRTLLYLVLLLAVIGGCHWWHRPASRKSQDRAPPEPPEEGEVLDTPMEGTERAEGSPGRSPGTVPPRDPQVTYAELSGPCEGQQDPSATYENVL